MKRFTALAIVFMALSVPAWSQTTISRTVNLTSALPIQPAATPWISEKGTGVKSHTIVWTTLGTVTTCSVKVQKSEDGVSWADMISGATCTSPSSTGAITTDIANYVRINATTLTGTGTLVVTYFAFSPGASLSATIDTTGLATSALQSATQYVEDAAATEGGTGFYPLGVRRDTAAPSCGTDGDNCYLGISSAGGLLTTPTIIDAAEGAAVATAPVPIGCVYRTSFTALDAGDIGYPICDVASRIVVAQGATPTTQSSVLECLIQAGVGTAADTSNHANCKNAPGNLYGYEAINTSATLAYLRLYNLTTDPTCTSATGFIRSIPIPASATGAGVEVDFSVPVGYTTGIGYCVTATGANTNNGAPPAGVFITLRYK